MKRYGALLFAALISQGCMKETKIIEQQIIPERLAPRDVKESMSVPSETEVVIKKSSLGKTFLLLPNIRTGGRKPQWADFKGILVSFEKSGNQLGLFKLTTDNLYSDIPADNLMQRFTIVSEDQDSIRFDLSKGLQSLHLSANYEVIMNNKDLRKKLQAADSGNDEAIEMKDTYLRSVKMENDRLTIEQVTRIFSEEITEGQKLEKTESTGTLRLELRPYTPSKTFQPLAFDKNQRIGSFLTLANQAGKDYPTPFAMKWDISPEAGPIKLVVAENTPKEIAQAVFEAGQYWNRALGRDIFVGITRGSSGDLPQEREMIVRWINWESAGFAYASAQPDPVTGEILRAQVFLTSSWYKIAKELMAKGSQLDVDVPNIVAKSAFCFLNQSELGTLAELSQAKESHRQKVALDVIRTVVAHEMGHAIGMRHNFAGSLTAPTQDKEKIRISKTYVKEENHVGAPLSSTVMDYTNMLTTAINGAYLKQSVLPYDQHFINWSYLNRPVEIEKYKYCSDEHIAVANSEGKSIYGCERFDDLQNPLMGALYSIRKAMKNQVFNTWQSTIESVKEEGLFTPSKKPTFEINHNFTSLNKILYLAEGKGFDPLVSLKSAIDSSVKDKISEDGVSLKEKLSKDMAEVGNIKGILNWLMPDPEQKGTFFQNQFDRLFQQMTWTDYPYLTEAQFEEYKKEMKAAAIKADQSLNRAILVAVLPVSPLRYAIPESSTKSLEADQKDTQKKPNEFIFKYRTELKISQADIPDLFKMARENILSRQVPKKVRVYDQEIELQLEDLSAQDNLKFLLVKYVSPERYPESIKSNTELFKEEKELLKAELMKNVIKVLETAKKLPSELSYKDLTAAIQSLEDSKLVNVTKAELLSELAILTLMPEDPKP
ncbi:MAG: hypothetical protein BroJett040_11970 [Oligoflexia bacterium]|nr:MAG: hypothetical protein BroJett040_11970 [Oligoflexia bacterium]